MNLYSALYINPLSLTLHCHLKPPIKSVVLGLIARPALGLHRAPAHRVSSTIGQYSRLNHRDITIFSMVADSPSPILKLIGSECWSLGSLADPISTRTRFGVLQIPLSAAEICSEKETRNVGHWCLISSDCSLYRETTHWVQKKPTIR